MSQGSSPLSATIASMSTNELATDLPLALSQLPEDKRAEVARAISRVLPLPSDPIRDRIWLIIVSAFATVMVGTALALGVGVFITSTDATKQITRADTILTVFTTVVGFLAGLLSPSPLGNRNG